MRNPHPLSLLSAGLAAALLTLSVAAVAETTVENADYWRQNGQHSIRVAEDLQPIDRHAKNVILFVGDGMGISTVTAARIFEGQGKADNRGGEENLLSFEKAPYMALSKTYSVNQQTSDSAPTMTAMITGVKTNDGELSVSMEVARKEKSAEVVNQYKVKTLLEQAEERGLSTGIVSTARITHATPAACYAHTSERDWESDAQMPADATVSDIAKQLVNFSYGDGLEVAMGGGRSMFLPNTQTDPEDTASKGGRKDGLDLTQQWLSHYAKSAYVYDKTGFDAVDAKSTDHLLGLFERSHMEYETDRANDTGGEPSLTEMTEKAIDILSKNRKGYVLMVEAGRIDHAHHAGNAYRALADTVELSNAVRKAVEKTDAKDTLIVVTADHSHTFTIAGYPGRGNPITGLVKEPGATVFAKDSNGLPYTTLGYANGPGYRGPNPRPDLTDVDTSHPDFLQEAAIPMASETHAGEDVAIYAYGPKAHLFHGVQEQSYIYHVMARALKLPVGQ
ncbi:alkaline phosphatase [Methylococcaceae bacterium WWC4]|uniref:alkaline phosphatase n=1 Tax=Methylomonas sp. LWB TaxID=1905845 RepID=UPI0008D98906|nr:alkaline phosphatase [Methylomonas sp. LWB]NJA07285.1 alkaline phosphatase [Methylococcaceae bacterium WWC4]OHX34535.1 alkaline phosphatase [Methylomonas sp. LWB]